jgi:GNAT superfamily N-acetyltransferase
MLIRLATKEDIGGVASLVERYWEFESHEVRSSGVGSLLVASAERELAARGLVRLQLQLGIDNDRARLFYERHGFRRRAGYDLLDKPLQAT